MTESTPEPLDPYTRANAHFTESFPFAELSKIPSEHVVVVACMDTRVDPLAILGLEVGDAHILRNAGGRVTDDVLRSVIVSTNLLQTRVIIVMHHTGCGMLDTTTPALADAVAQTAGHRPDSIEFHPIGPDSLTQDVQRLRDCPYLPDGVVVAGYTYHVETGAIEPFAD